jgi:hypothetical protein
LLSSLSLSSSSSTQLKSLKELLESSSFFTSFLSFSSILLSLFSLLLSTFSSSFSSSIFLNSFNSSSPNFPVCFFSSFEFELLFSSFIVEPESSDDSSPE